MKRKIFSKRSTLMVIIIVIVVCFSTGNFRSKSYLLANGTSIVIMFKIGNPIMIVNGKSFEVDPITKVTPLIIKEWNRVIVPIRTIAEVFGGWVRWDSYEKKVSFKFKGAFIEFWVNNPICKVNGENFLIDEKNNKVCPIILKNRVFIPLRFIFEILGSNVEWLNDEQCIRITFPDSLVRLPNKEILVKLKDQDILSFSIPIRNPFIWKTSIRIRLISIDCPKDWSSDFCAKNSCYFKEGYFEILPREDFEIVVSIYPRTLSSANYSLIIDGDEVSEEIIKISIKEDSQ